MLVMLLSVALLPQAALAQQASPQATPAPAPPSSNTDGSGTDDSSLLGYYIPGLDTFFLVYSLVVIVLQSVSLAKKLIEEVKAGAQKDVLWYVLRKIYLHGSENPTVAEAKKKLADGGDRRMFAIVSIFGVIFIQAMCVMLNLLRLFDFDFAGCSTSSCRKMAGNNVFSGVLAILNFCLAAMISAPCGAFAYKNDGNLLWKMTESFIVLSYKGISVAWQAYDSAGQRSQIIETDDELVWLYILSGFVAASMVESMCVSLDLAAKWKGCHTLFHSAMEHNFIMRMLRVCLKPLYEGMGQKAIYGGQAKWLAAYAAAQDEMRIDGLSIPPELDLSKSAILSACEWRGGDANALFDRLKKDTDREGNWIADGNHGMHGPGKGKSYFLV